VPLNIVIVARRTEDTLKLCSELKQQGFQCSVINGNDALENVNKNNTNLLLVEFTDSTDTEALYRYFHNEKGLPIIVLAPVEKLDSLYNLVDDFVIQPCNARELAARAKRLVKKETDASKEQITRGGIVIDPDKYEVYVDGKLISLTFKEYELLKFLASNPGRVFTRDTLLNQVWSEDYFGGDRTVDVHIRRLRSKIEDSSHIYIETVRNIGYRFLKK
jgi:DNA-binding response OmpR family regulator